MWAQFEEKQFEQPLNAELTRAAGDTFLPIGQVLEKHLGFDAAIYTSDLSFWDRFRLSVASGIGPGSPEWGKVTDSKINELPPILFNAFIQHKRPYQCKGPRSTFRRRFGGSYYRFEITSHQQNALARLEMILGYLGIVAYACPAFHTHRSLVTYMLEKKLVAQTCFVKPSLLVGHTRFNYKGPTDEGVANIEPKDVSVIRILEEIKKRYTEQRVMASNTETLQYLGKSARMIALEVPHLKLSFVELSDHLSLSELEPGVRGLIEILTLKYLIGCDWFVGFAQQGLKS
jgi:hypothetical protein